MNKKIIPCRVREEYVEGAGVAAGAAGSGGDAVLQLEFGPMWEALVKYVTFRDARKENPVTVLLTTDMIERILVAGAGGGHAGVVVPHGVDGRDTGWEGAPGVACPTEGKGCGECPCREVLVYNVPIPAKAMALAGQMGVVVQGYELTEDGKKVQAASMTANAYYKILPADYAPVEDGSVTATLSQQLQAQIEKIKGDIVGAAEAHDAKTAAQKAAAEAQAAKEAAQSQAQGAEKWARAAAGSAGEAKAAAGEAKTAGTAARAAAEKSEEARKKAEAARTGAETARAGAEDAGHAARLARVGSEEAENRAKLYRDEALSARDAAREAGERAAEAREEALEAKETAQECRDRAWNERVLAQDARDKAEEWAEQSGVYKDQALTAMKRSEDARDEAVLALQWIRMEHGDIQKEAEEVRTVGQEVRQLREETGADREAAQEARRGAEAARDGAETAQGRAVQARYGAEEAEKKAREWAETARDLSGGDVATRREAKGYVKAHNADPLAHEGLFPRIGFVAGERVRDSWRPEYGLGGGGEEGGERSVTLETEAYTGRAYLTVVVSGKEYDGVNLETEKEVAEDGTLIVGRAE